ncbi:shikimate kinase [Tindallia californiensis]|uniref:Shikimate kinase n=1 Tax=Tindallia californiensis TaxID=159292 RepID=A0A1H3NJK4_9FIRM|nr:shikimate kinase [Tindallia californiensis]SDY88860.1 shikimate kinase [Tindallia californiensis]
MEKLEKLRTEIDKLDKDIAVLLEKRFKVSMHIIKQKKEEKLPLFHPERENEVINRVCSYVSDERFIEEIKCIQNLIIRMSRQVQSKYMFQKHIFITGFMGSGKTSIAKKVADMLAMNIVEMDSEIEQRCNQSISDIFHMKGEGFFREMEHALLNEITESDVKSVVSTGGGIVLKESNVHLLKKHGIVIWLKATPKDIFSRLSNDAQRPLLKDNMSIERIEKMMNERDSAYRQVADFSIQTSHEKIDDIALEIVKFLGSVQDDK